MKLQSASISGRLPLLLALFLLLPPITARAGHVTGLVSDQSSRPVAIARVALEGTNYSAVTDEAGRFALNSVAAGSYQVRVTAMGYEPWYREISVASRDTLHLSITLQVEPLALDETIKVRTSLVGNRERLFRIPGSAHYLEAAELQKFKLTDIHQILRDVPGMNVQEEDGYGLRPNIGFRGTGANRSQKISVMEDGILIAPAPYASPAAYYFPTVGRMNGIEVRKGSSQVKYGPHTTGGALNLLSTPVRSEFGGQVELSGGQDGARRLHANVSSTMANVGFLAETYQESVDGFKRLDGGGPTGFDKSDYMLKGRVQTDRDANVFQLVEIKIGQTSELSNETYLGLTDADFAIDPVRRYAASQEDLMDADHEQYHLRHFIQPSPGLDITTTLYRSTFHRNWYKLDKVRTSAGGSSVSIGSVLADPGTYAAEYEVLTGQVNSNDDALEVKANNREYFAHGVQSNIALRWRNQAAEFGLRYHEDEEDRFQWVDAYRITDGRMMQTTAGTPGTESNRISGARAWAGFAELSLTFGSLTAVPGVRYEHIVLTRDDYGTSDPGREGTSLSHRRNDVDVLIPGLGLDYRLNSRLSVFGGIHKGFAPPGSSVGTEPEESVNHELGVRYRKIDFSFQGVVFYNDYTSLLGADLSGAGGTGSGDLFNGGAAEVKGLELSVTYALHQAFGHRAVRLPFRLAYTYTDGQFTHSFESDFEPWGTVASGDELPYVPKHQLSIVGGIETDRLAINLSASYTDRMRTVAGQGDLVDSESTDAHFLLGAAADYAVTGGLKLFAAVRNLTDDVYIAARRPAGVRPGLPRTFSVGVRTDF